MTYIDTESINPFIEWLDSCGSPYSEKCKNFFNDFSILFYLMEEPNATVMDDGSISVAWDKDEHHLEATVNENISLKYTNNITGVTSYL